MAESLKKNRKRHGFTLVELLVVIGIIAVLISLLVPYINRAFKQAGRTRIAADLASLATAIENYKQEFGDIPRTSGNDTGAPSLGKAMVGPYGSTVPAFDGAKTYKAGDCVVNGGSYWVALKETSSTPPGAVGEWAAYDGRDGRDGPGFVVRQGASKTYGPYLEIGKWKLQGCNLLDKNGNVILYFPARPGRVNVTEQSVPAYVGQAGSFLYNADDNFNAFRREGEAAAQNAIILARMRIMLGDFKSDGWIDAAAGDVAVSQPYLLWSPGPDGLFGPVGYSPNPAVPSADEIIANRKAAINCDDVTNFQIQ